MDFRPQRFSFNVKYRLYAIQFLANDVKFDFSASKYSWKSADAADIWVHEKCLILLLPNFTGCILLLSQLIGNNIPETHLSVPPPLQTVSTEGSSRWPHTLLLEASLWSACLVPEGFTIPPALKWVSLALMSRLAFGSVSSRKPDSRPACPGLGWALQPQSQRIGTARVSPRG